MIDFCRRQSAAFADTTQIRNLSAAAMLEPSSYFAPAELKAFNAFIARSAFIVHCSRVTARNNFMP
jgi:hypothetical protein